MAKNPVILPNSEEIARFLEERRISPILYLGLRRKAMSVPEEIYVNWKRMTMKMWKKIKPFGKHKKSFFRTSTFESKIRQAVKYNLEEIKLAGSECSCRRLTAEGCRSCTRKEISVRLQNVGYNCVICNSKWKSSSEIPSGHHWYLEVMEKSKKGDVRVVIELNFRAEFEMARGSEEYNRLVNRLPEVYVGKTERLKAVIKIMCAAAKKCMKEKKMHMAPWRRLKYMQTKWLGGYQRTQKQHQ